MPIPHEQVCPIEAQNRYVGRCIMPCTPNAPRPEEKREDEVVDPAKYRFSGYQLPRDAQKDNVEAKLLYWSQPAFWSYRATTGQNWDMR
jgi:hypothetical protein